MMRRAALLVLAAVMWGCPEEEPPPPPVPPEIGMVSLDCVDASDTNIEAQILAEVRAQVRDPDLDLVEVRGSLASIAMELSDDDADDIYTWSPQAGLDPIVCRNALPVRIEAIDLAGNEVIFEEGVSP